eukprot:scaffold150515_cov42-Tisochrysis_lutea.AAC.1
MELWINSRHCVNKGSGRGGAGGHRARAVRMNRGRGKAWRAAEGLSTQGRAAHGRVTGLGIIGVGHR